MNKIQKTIVSILLILAAIIMHILLDGSVRLNEELIGFLAGFCFAGGIFFVYKHIFKKENQRLRAFAREKK